MPRPPARSRPRRRTARAERGAARGVSRRRRVAAPVPIVPARYGVVDVGSNAIRLQVIEIRDAAGEPLVLESRREAVRLGQDVFLTGSIPQASVRGAVEALRRFAALCQRWQVKGIRAVATSAVREAANRERILRRIEEASGIRVEVISGAEEAWLLARGVEARLDLSRGRSLLVDVGGGSVEVTLVEDGQVTFSESYRLGAVRLLEALARAPQAKGQSREGVNFVELVEQYVGSLDGRIRERLGLARIARFVATGGNVESLADLAARAGTLRKSDGCDALQCKDLAGWIQRLAGLSYGERVQQLGLAPDRADVILPAAVVYYRLASLARVPEILVPRVGLRDGLLREVVAGHLETAHAAERRETVLAGARALARKYHSDLEHVEKVCELSLRLFDQTAELHRLGAEERVLLEAAALLHDVGTFVATSAHHKHGYYLIRNSDLVGLSDEERELVALVARYHRRSAPKPSHEPFQLLPRTDRARTLKLAALLRLADALDREHQGKVADVSVELGPRSVQLRLHVRRGTRDGLALERWAVGRKDELFQMAFNRRVRVSE